MGKPTKNGFVEYRHFRVHGQNCDDFPAITFRCEVDQEKDTITVSWANCTAEDNFCRAKGVAIADRRAANGEVVTGQYLRAANLVGNALIQLREAKERMRYTTPDKKFARHVDLALESADAIAAWEFFA